MKPNRIRLFIKPHCPWCKDAMAWLDARGVAYEKLDVNADDAARSEMIELSRQTFVPTLDAGGHILSDFDTGQLEQFWRTLDKSPYGA